MLYPINTETRTVLELNGVWRFRLLNDTDIFNASQPISADQVMAVPASYNDQTALDDVRFHIGDVVYERDFTVPNLLLSEKLHLRFGAVTHKATVYLNGKEICQHRGGFTPFEAVINDELLAGENRLTVVVNNIIDYTTLPVGVHKKGYEAFLDMEIHTNQPNFDFFNYAGINRPVKIYSTPQTYIKDIILPYDLTASTARVRAEVEVEGEYDELLFYVYDEDKNLLLETKDNDFTLGNIIRWEPLASYLYEIKVSILKDNQIIDTYTEELGFRTVEVKDNQFLINDKPFYFKGFGKHEDTPMHGRGFNEVANVLDLNLFKWLGANSFRTSHYPYSEEMMRLANQQGIVVIDEVPAVGIYAGFQASLNHNESGKTFEVMDTAEAHHQALRELIERDKNLACVVMWSVANEPASHEKGAKEYFSPLIEFTKSYDPQHRPVTVVFIQHRTVEENQVAELVDVISINRYYGWYLLINEMEQAERGFNLELTKWEELHPGKPIIIAEYGADAIDGFHSVTSQPWTEEYQVAYYEMSNRALDNHTKVVGEHAWNFSDFETAAVTKRANGNRKGAFTRDRNPKMVVQYLRERWLDIPDFGYKDSLK